MGVDSMSKCNEKVLTIHLPVVYMSHLMRRYVCTGVTTQLVVCCMRGQC